MKQAYMKVLYWAVQNGAQPKGKLQNTDDSFMG